MFPLRTLILVNVLNSNDGSNEFLTLSLLYMIYDILYRTVRIYINMHTHIFLHWRRVLCCDSWRCLGNTPVFISRRAEGAVGNFHCWRAHPPSLSNPSSFCSAVTWSGLSESHCCGYARSKALCVCVCCRMNITPGKAEMSRFNISPDDDTSSTSSNSIEYSNGPTKKVPLTRYCLYYLLLLT